MKTLIESCEEAIASNKKVVDTYLEGNNTSLNFLIGVTLRISEREFDYKTIKNKLVELLK